MKITVKHGTQIISDEIKIEVLGNAREVLETYIIKETSNAIIIKKLKDGL